VSRWQFFLPLAGFVAIGVFLVHRVFSVEDVQLLPSALVGKSFPAFDLPVLGDAARRVNEEALLGQVRLVNVWATWCPTCIAEHQQLVDINAQTGVSIVGINYKDDETKAISWLEQFGNPYDFSVIDATGDLGVELGVYGAPESFLVDQTGRIRYKRVGDINQRVWEAEIKPILESLADHNK